MALIPTTDGDPRSNRATTDVAPPSASLQGIPPELRNKIYDHLLTEPRNVSGRRLLELREDSPSGDLWKQFLSAIPVHPLIATCRQMRTEFGSILATTAGQTYCLTVDNLDPHQLALLRKFVATYCFSYRVSDKSFPPLLFQELILCLKLDSNILPSIEAYGLAVRLQPRMYYGVITAAFLEIMILPGVGSSVSDNSTNKSRSMTKAQAKLARGSLRRMCDAYDLCEPDLRVMRLLVTHLTAMVDNHWPATSDEIGDAWRSLQAKATLYKAPCFTNAPRSNNAPRSSNSNEPENDIGMKILPALLFVVVVGILRLVAE